MLSKVGFFPVYSDTRNYIDFWLQLEFELHLITFWTPLAKPTTAYAFEQLEQIEHL